MKRMLYLIILLLVLLFIWLGIDTYNYLKTIPNRDEAISFVFEDEDMQWNNLTKEEEVFFNKD